MILTATGMVSLVSPRRRQIRLLNTHASFVAQILIPEHLAPFRRRGRGFAFLTNRATQIKAGDSPPRKASEKGSRLGANVVVTFLLNFSESCNTVSRAITQPRGFSLKTHSRLIPNPLVFRIYTERRQFEPLVVVAAAPLDCVWYDYSCVYLNL